MSRSHVDLELYAERDVGKLSSNHGKNKSSYTHGCRALTWRLARLSCNYQNFKIVADARSGVFVSSVTVCYIYIYIVLFNFY